MADILIRGMEMPKNCSRCQFCFGANNICPWTREYATSTKRHPDCPLIELPPHGRLIDADKLLAKENQHLEYLSDEWYVEVRTVDNATTIIEASEAE